MKYFVLICFLVISYLLYHFGVESTANISVASKNLLLWSGIFMAWGWQNFNSDTWKKINDRTTN